MSMATTIRSLSVEKLDIPLLAPFGIATGAQEVARNLLVRLELADGTVGYGEAAPFPAFNGETQDAARAAIEAAQSSVEGADVREWRRIATAIKSAMGPIGSAQCAIETALLDALTRQANMPLWAFFGGVTKSLETDMTISTGSVEEAVSSAQDILSRGITVIKINVGSGDVKLDIDRICAVHAAAPAAPLLLDGNSGFVADAALQLLSALHSCGITPTLFEQPVKKDDLEGMAMVSKWGGVPVAADESLEYVGDIARLVQMRAAQVLNIKLMKRGVIEAMDIAAAARATNLRLTIGSMVESTLAVTVSACFAAGQGGFAFADLDKPMFLAENPFEGGVVQRGATLDLSEITAGHGVIPKAKG